MDILDRSTIDAELAQVPGWTSADEAIHRNYQLASFRQAIDLIVQIADLADAADHHPELTNVYNRLSVTLTTHDAGGVTRRDIELARRIEAAAQEFGDV